VGILAIIEVVALGLTIASAVTAATESRIQGIAGDKMARQRARAEADKARQQQIDARQNMDRGLAAQNAQAAVGGLGTSKNTSFGANLTRQINQGQNDLLASRAGSSATTSLLDTQGQMAAEAGTIGAAIDTMKGISGAADMYVGDVKLGQQTGKGLGRG
jgi:hypothetical protein